MQMYLQQMHLCLVNPQKRGYIPSGVEGVRDIMSGGLGHQVLHVP